ncbi:hypothetical protein [Rugamonas rivuli]|uniref:Lipoprotein n=1 Tax=Rugamonas rivuli TaxID=2743358 RepID=A0A843SQ73_9BURK|nr:hypothetical protein [Rugamonas rivuli]MQA23017.1 hypothetical protein [Rugamonas rivuli]
MQRLFSLLLPLALASGCALAQAPKAIEDVEPEVTQQVAAAVAKMAIDPAAEGAALLRPCASPPPLELLRRTVDGEERTYLYRTQCGKPLLVSATYGKNGAIKRLQLKTE